MVMMLSGWQLAAVCVVSLIGAMASTLSRLSLDGLADRWETDEVCRRRMLNDHSLMVWSKPELTGVPSMEHAKMNYVPLLFFFEEWVKVCDCPRTPSLPQVKKQAGAALPVHHMSFPAKLNL